jgi:hypothetical protein
LDEAPAKALLARYEREASALRFRAVALVIVAASLMGGSVVVAVLAGASLALHAVTGLQIAFVLGLGAIIGACVTVMRLAGANEHAGAAARLREGKVALRSAAVGGTDARTMLRLVFADGHRADLFVTKEEAGVLLPLIEARVDRGKASAYR